MNKNLVNVLEVKDMFSRIAKRYDLTNTVLSTGLHKYWNASLVKTLLHHTKKSSPSLLDLCSGTGEIGYRFLKRTQRSQGNQASISSLHFLDFCEEMVEIAKKNAPKTAPCPLHFILADAKSIPLESSTKDLVSLAYGIRNIDEPSLAFQEMFRVLKPGGLAGILELTRPKSTFFRFFHRFWLKKVLPFLGAIVTGDKKAYHYLKNSIESFLEPKELIRLAKQEGFSLLEQRPLSFGIATLLIFEKPL